MDDMRAPQKCGQTINFPEFKVIVIDLLSPVMENSLSTTTGATTPHK